MQKFADYILDEKISESRSSSIYRGYKDNQPQTVIIKLLKTFYPKPSQIARFIQEYQSIKNLDLRGIIRTLDIIRNDDEFALILEDFDGISLKSHINNNNDFDIKSFLNLSVNISETIGSIHMREIVHRNIKPHNIIINPLTGESRITDFGISSVLTRENDEVYNYDFITNTLVYMSPEQTGRVNRSVDYRTDLYSLGITLYEVLTGTVPFKSIDPMELIHSHIAIIPESPANLDSRIPDVISEIIMKLLSKNPEERYQNSFGLMADLNECLRQLNTTGRIDNFRLASKDISIKFNIPQIIVGREDESNLLLSAFESSSRGNSEMQLVLGHPGIGKSALIFEMQRPILGKKGYFIFGKYDQLRKDVPYSSIIQAFQGLIKQLISESDERINSWREKLLNALGPNGKVITDFIPALEYIIGKQPDIETLDPEESQNRFNIVFQNFLNAFTTSDHPLTLYLDDLQWADLASLKLLKAIMTNPSTKYLFLIGAYRDYELTPHHPLSITLDEIQKNGKKINSIYLAPLNVANVNKMIMNVLRCPAEKSAGLTDLIHKKTGGNPFFINQFLKNLYDSKVIELDHINGWTWDMERIRQTQFTDNVVEFMAEKILSLPANTREILKVCASIGNRFDLETLSIVLNRSIEEVLADITAAIQEDLVNIYGNIYKFHHDRIQEAAYSLIPDSEKTRLHYLIGKNVLEKTSALNLSEKMFYIVDQLNMGIDLVTESGERLYLAEMNMKAAQKAKNSTAYSSALNYARTGINLLPENSWIECYRLTFTLYNEMLECEYLTGEYDNAEKTFSTIVKNSNNNIDRANVHSHMIILKNSTGDFESALKIGFEGLKIIGTTMPDRVSDIRLAIQLIKLRFSFGRKKIEYLLDMPDTADEEFLAFAYLCIYTGTVAYFINVNLFSYIVTRGIRLLIKFGNFEYSSLAYNAIGSILIAGFGLYDRGHRFGRTALALYNKTGSIKNHCKIHFLFVFLNLHWKEHARTGFDYLRDAYKAGILAGDLLYCRYSISVLTMYRIMLGENLDDILEEADPYRDFQMSIDPFTKRNHIENTQVIRCLKGQTSVRGCLNGDNFDESEQLEYFTSSGNSLGQVYTLTAMLRVRYIFGLYSDCGTLCKKLFILIKHRAAIGTFHVPEFYFYYSLYMTAVYKNSGPYIKFRSRIRLMLNQMRMKIWSKNCPQNFEHKYLLVEAEREKLRGNEKKAVRLYDKAIKSAHQNRYIQNEAIANELASIFYKSIGYEKVAKSYMQDSFKCYERLGATGKIAVLLEEHPYLTAGITKSISADLNNSSTSAPDDKVLASSKLDISTIMKVSQAISSEIILGRLLKTIMKIAVVNAGAQKGFFILDTDGNLTIEASEEDGIERRQSIPYDSFDGLSKPIVNYVHRSGEDVILGNASVEGSFTNDPYIIKNRIKSVLCASIKSKGKISGILYMENNLTDNAFTPERIEPLRIISSQAAISIENARLFELATTDGLTKLYVHRYFQLLLDQEILRSKRHKKQFSLIMIDIDNFKSFNDTYGHQLGDEVLKNVARAVKNISRGEDVIARYGGEEFVLILPEMDTRQAMIVAEKIRSMVEKLEIIHDKKTLHVTISLGVATFPWHASEKEELIYMADAALYISKGNGKNRVSLIEK